MIKKTLFLYLLVPVFLFCTTGAEGGQWLSKKIRGRLAEKVRKKNAEIELESERNYLNYGGRNRSYYVYEPDGWNEKSSLPLVLLFHGGGGNARSALHYYELEKTAEKHNFLLVAPNGTGEHKDVFLTWNVNFGFGNAYENNVDDIGFVKMLIKKINKDYPVDTDRMYATGLSNGAIFCNFLAAQPHNRLAAIAPVVGTVGGSEPKKKEIIMPPDPVAPVAVCMIQGIKDQHIPVEGGMQKKSAGDPRYMLSVADSLSWWAKANSCVKPPDIDFDSDLNATLVKYSAGSNFAPVFGYLIHNQGHAWPGSPEKPYPKADKPAPQFPANEIIWKFFKNNPRNYDTDKIRE